LLHKEDDVVVTAAVFRACLTNQEALLERKKDKNYELIQKVDQQSARDRDVSALPFCAGREGTRSRLPRLSQRDREESPMRRLNKASPMSTRLRTIPWFFLNFAAFAVLSCWVAFRHLCHGISQHTRRK